MLKTVFKGRSFNRENATYVLGLAFELLPDNDPNNTCFLDVGSGYGNLLDLVLERNFTKCAVGIERRPDFAEVSRTEVPDAVLFENDLLDRYFPAMELANSLRNKPTVAFIYDGGIFDFDVLRTVSALLATVLPSKSVVVFVTAVAQGKYDASNIIKMVQSFKRHFYIGAVHNISETDDPDDPNPTMQAIYFAEKGFDASRFYADEKLELGFQKSDSVFKTSLKPLPSIHKNSL